MKLDITKIPGYKDGMSAEEQLKLIQGYEIDMSGYVKKDVADKYASEAAEYKKKYTSTLTDSEQKATETAEKFNEMETELNALRRERSISKYTAKYVGLGFDEKLADETATAFADGKMDVVFTNFAKHQEAVKANVKAELLRETPRPGAGTPGSTGIDYAKMAQDAATRGDNVASVYYTRLSQQQETTTTT